MVVVDVGLDSRTAGAQAVYTYGVPEGVSVTTGDAYFVPLGPRRAIGFVLSIKTVEPDGLDFPLSQLRFLGPRITGLELPHHVLNVLEEVARQTLSPIATALSLAVPPSIRDRLLTSWSLRSDASSVASTGLSTAQTEVLRLLSEQREVIDSKKNPIADGAKKTLRSLERKGLVQQSVALSPAQERHRLTGLFRLTADPTLVDAFLTGPGKKKPAQAVTIMRLQGSENASFSAQEIKSIGSVTDQTVKSLVQAGLLVEVSDEQGSIRPQPVPNDDQLKAMRAIVEAVAAHSSRLFLLYGVTGSGKTEVYLRSASEALKAGRQVLYLVPEIALTAQVIAQLRERFGNLVAVVHSNMSPTERLETWLKVKRGVCPVVLGPRSALFSPLTNVGLVIVDEEHESSYKQESTPRYQTKQICEHLGRIHGCPVVFGSATPNIESFFRAQQGEIELLSLPQRAASATLPTVETVNLAELYRSGKPSLLSPVLDGLLREAVKKGDQAILFLNRRAYSPFLVCRDCGHRFVCRQCAVSLAYHRREQRLRCHQCGHQESVPDICPECAGSRVAPFGTGTEKVEEAVAALFPGVKVARLDRDIARKKGALEETIAAFRSRDIQILVGTQMVAKGLDFPGVTVVGVIAADISLNVPDFRSSERTFQLLSQVAGRAGRGTKPGTVVIQTLSPENPAVLAAKDHDFEEFYSWELEQRREAGYPPFSRLVNVLCTGDNRDDVVGLSAVVAQKLKLQLRDATVLGPVDCPIERIQNLWRRHVLIKLPPRSDVMPVQRCLEGLKSARARLVVDVDPVSLI